MVLQPASRKIEDANSTEISKRRDGTNKATHELNSKARKVPWQSRRVSSCRSRTTETIILSDLTRKCQKVGEKSGQRKSTASIEKEKKEQQRGGTKEDQSLQGTTKLVRVIPAKKIKKKQSILKTTYDLQG